MVSAPAPRVKSGPESASVDGLKALLQEDLAARSDTEIAALQNVINVAITRLLHALTSPFTLPVEKFLEDIQRVTAYSPVSMSECTRNRAFYFGQVFALAEIAGTVRHMKVPAEAAAVALSRSDTEPILRLLVKRDAITKTALAAELGKASQNLHPLLQELEQCGLLRRDQIGRSVVYSPTSLTRICLSWMEKAQIAAAHPASEPVGS